MPIYEYRCDECGAEFERLTRSRSSADCCPDCDSPNLTRVYSTFGVGASETGPAPGSSGGCACTPTTCGCRVH